MWKSEKRKYILVDVKFQLKLILLINILFLIIFAFYPLLIHDLLERSVDSGDIPAQNFEKIFKASLVYLVILQVILQAILSIVILFISHRIAGPIKKVIDVLNAFSRGEFFDQIRFRKADYFRHILVPLQKLNSRIANETQQLNEIEAILSSLNTAQINPKTRENLEVVKAKIKRLKEASEPNS